MILVEFFISLNFLAILVKQCTQTLVGNVPYFDTDRQALTQIHFGDHMQITPGRFAYLQDYFTAQVRSGQMSLERYDELNNIIAKNRQGRRSWVWRNWVWRSWKPVLKLRPTKVEGKMATISFTGNAQTKNIFSQINKGDYSTWLELAADLEKSYLKAEEPYHRSRNTMDPADMHVVLENGQIYRVSVARTRGRGPKVKPVGGPIYVDGSASGGGELYSDLERQFLKRKWAGMGPKRARAMTREEAVDRLQGTMRRQHERYSNLMTPNFDAYFMSAGGGLETRTDTRPYPTNLMSERRDWQIMEELIAHGVDPAEIRDHARDRVLAGMAERVLQKREQGIRRRWRPKLETIQESELETANFENTKMNLNRALTRNSQRRRKYFDQHKPPISRARSKFSRLRKRTGKWTGK